MLNPNCSFGLVIRVWARPAAAPSRETTSSSERMSCRFCIYYPLSTLGVMSSGRSSRRDPPAAGFTPLSQPRASNFSTSPEDRPGHAPLHLPALERDPPVDDHGHDARRLGPPARKAPPVRPPPRVENDQVGTRPGPEHAAIAEPENLGRIRGHLAHRLLAVEHPVLADEAREDAREGPVGGRVRERARGVLG